MLPSVSLMTVKLSKLTLYDGDCLAAILSGYGGLSKDASAEEALSLSCLSMASTSAFVKNTAGSLDRLAGYLATDSLSLLVA